jgi:hypothetical protein
MSAGLRRVAGWGASAAVLAAVAFALRGRVTAVGAVGGLPGPVPSVVAVAANIAANATLVVAWQRVLSAGRVHLTFDTAAWIWGVSQLARYTVGAAQVGGRALAGRPYGVTPTAGAVTTLVEVAWQTSLTALLSLATVPWWLPGAEQVEWLALVAVLPAAVLLAGLVAPQRLLAAVARAGAAAPVRRLTRGRLVGVARDVALDRAGAARLTLLYALNSALRLLAFLTLFAAVGGDVASDGLRAVGAYALGQLVGRLAVFAPGGLGPREGATALVVAPAIGGGPALVLVAAVRLLELVAEALFFLAARLRRPPPPRTFGSAGVTGGR